MAALLAPVLIIVAILLLGVEHPEASTAGKGNLQIAFTGSITTTTGFSLSYQSVLLNVIAVRVNPSSDITVSESDPNWQIISVPDGTNKTTSVPSLSYGGNFGPNGFAVSVGQGRSEVQIDLAALQNTVAVFNTGSVKAKTYNQIELSLDPTVPGIVIPQCGTGTGTGEGCIPYPLQFPPNSPFSSVRAIAPINVTRSDTQLLTVAINTLLGPSPSTSSQFVSVTPSICVPGVNSGTVATCPNTTTAPPFPSNPNGSSLTINAGVITGNVSGATNNTIVNAELHGTSTIISSVKVNKTTHTYTMSLPAPANYDFFTSGRGRSIDAQQNVPVPVGPFTLDFTVKQQASEGLSGTVLDACSSNALQGATLELYKPADQIYPDGSTTPVDCTASPPPTECATTCDPSTTGQIPAGCMVFATASTDDLGNYPLPGSGNVTPPFKQIPIFKTGAYALKTTMSGYNGSLQPVTTQSGGALKCPNSGFKNKACNASLQHGEIDVTTSIISAGGPTPVSALNILVNAEDSGTFNGEGVGVVTVPAGAATNNAPVPVFVPVSPTASPTATASSSPGAGSAEFDAAAKATPTASASGTPVVIGGPASFDLFGTTMDLFGAAPQKNSGHTIGVLSGVPAPELCANSTSNPPAPQATLSGFTCVGHGSAPGVILSTPDATTQIVVSKADTSGSQVDVTTTGVVPAGNQNGGSFAICEPADSAGYTITHVEVQPTATPSVVGSVSGVMLNTPIVVNSPTPSGTPSATPTCQGICSDFSQNTGGKSCLLCQGNSTIVNVP